MGKSFEIRPTGIAHANLLLPEELAPDYPKAQGKNEKGKVVEHYSWKKVTTNISGFILGSPTIDHYGDMVVRFLFSFFFLFFFAVNFAVKIEWPNIGDLYYE
jgi:hypothetical protein